MTVYRFREAGMNGDVIELVKVRNCSEDRIRRHLASYKQKAENPNIDEFIEYLEEQGAKVESVNPTEVSF